jgi:hypothetical protein
MGNSFAIAHSLTALARAGMAAPAATYLSAPR